MVRPSPSECLPWIRTALPGPVTTTSVRPVLTSHSISSTRDAIQEWEGGGTAPNFFVNVTCISKQCLVLGQLNGSLLAGDQDGKWEGELPDTSNSCRSFALWDGMSAWPSIWRLAPDILFPRSLNLVAIDMKLVAVNWNTGFSHSNWVQRPWQEMKQNTWFDLTTSLSHCLGLLLYATNGAPSQMWGCLQHGRKVVTYLQETTKVDNLKDGHNLSQLPLPNQISGFFSSVSMRAHPGMPEMWQGDFHMLCSGTLDELVSSHTKLVIYPTYAICCKKLWSMPYLILGSRGYR